MQQRINNAYTLATSVRKLSLTEREEQFAQLIANGSSQVDAYKKVYSTNKMSANTKACEVARRPKILARVAQLRAGSLEGFQLGP